MNAQIASNTHSEDVVTRVAGADFRSSRNGSLASLGFTAFLLVSAPAFAAVAPNLGTAASFTALGTNGIPTVGTLTCTNTGPGSTINGDVGSTFTSITNTACTITGATVAPVAGSVVTAFNNAYSSVPVLNPVCTGVIPTVTTTLPPGVYCSNAGTTIGAGVILTLNGTASDVWVFRIGTGGLGALTLTGAQVVPGGTAQACNVFWETAQDATLTDSAFIGTILSGGAVTTTRGNYVGRAMATTDVTVTDAGPMTFAGCAALPAGVAAVPTLSDWAKVMLAALLAVAGFAAMRRRAR
jgi:hypothetical protein